MAFSYKVLLSGIVMFLKVQRSESSECSDTGTLSSLVVNITCDRNMEVYVDGRLLGTGNKDVISTFLIDSSSHVIAIHCTGITGAWDGMILASLSNGLITDTSWLCTNQLEPGWNMGTFDDLDWPSAVSHDSNAHGGMVLPWGIKTEITDGAKFIWTSDNKNDLDVYCRRTLYSPCNEQRHRFFKSSDEYKDRALGNSIINTVVVNSATECGLKCGQIVNCASFNIEYNDEKTERVCELSNGKAVMPEVLDEKTGYQYYEMAKAGF